jgi:response regulator of citrate/malate metabolism
MNTSKVRNALIIDDEKDVRDTIELYLENMGCFNKILHSENGADATRKIHNQQFTIIALDMNLPKKDGVQIIKDIADSNNDVKKVVVISGFLDKNKMSDCIAQGVTRFMVKPFTEAQFQEKVLEALKA